MLNQKNNGNEVAYCGEIYEKMPDEMEVWPGFLSVEPGTDAIK